jgi:hypothetical protein
LGSLSTRTTHPHFINQLQRLLSDLDLKVQLVNPYRWKTKGEMLASCQSDVVRKFAHASYSCGKGKRLNQHCGRCVPCIIRRAAFLKARLPDKTGYHVDDLTSEAHNDDVFAARMAVAQLYARNVNRWVSEAGPLPDSPHERAHYVEVVRRGVEELKTFLDDFNWQ